MLGKVLVAVCVLNGALEALVHPLPKSKVGEESLSCPCEEKVCDLDTADRPGFFVDASFLYWYVQQDGMDFAIASASVGNPSSPPPYVIYAAQNASYQFPDFLYRPGFRVGLGVFGSPEDWTLLLEYTYLHQTTATSLGDPPADPRGSAVWSLSNWFGGSYPFSTTGIDTRWHTNLDLLDLSASYPCFQRRKGMIVPFVGLRGARLSQDFRLQTTIVSAVVGPVISENQSIFWGIGPRMGIQGKWFVGAGVRLEAGVDGSLLFAQFRVNHSDNLDISYSSPNLTLGGTSFKYKNYNTVRLMADMDLGVGWKIAFFDKNYFDLLATYEFFLMPSQNAMRQINNSYAAGLGTVPAGDFTAQGLTVKAALGF